jgi:hypothetical protein
MITNRTKVLAIALALVGGTAMAQDKKEGAAGGMQMPKPSPEWEAFTKGMEGSWKCDSTMPAGAMGPGSPEMKMQASAKIKKDMGGFWLVGTYEMKKTKTMPGMKGTFMMGSPDGKTFVSSNIDSAGNSSYSTGALAPDGGSTTGEGIMMGNKVKVRETMQKKSDKEVYHKVEMDMGKGFQVMGEDSCKK